MLAVREAIPAPRDLARAREAAQEAQKSGRDSSFSRSSFDMVASIRAAHPWSLAHMRWISTLKFEHPAHFIVLKEYCQAIEDAEVHLKRLTDLISETVESWTMAPVVEAYHHALHGISLLA